MAARLLALCALGCVLGGCGGGGGKSPAQLLPDRLGGVELQKESFTGKVWLKARPEGTFQPEVSADISTFLQLLHKLPADLLVAWALASDGPKVVAYRVRGVDTAALVRAYAAAVQSRYPGIRRTRTVLSRKDVTITSGITPERGYLYAKDGVL